MKSGIVLFLNKTLHLACKYSKCQADEIVS